MDERHWIGQCIWIAPEELAEVRDRHVTTINRHLQELYDEKLIDYIDVGRGGRSERRFCLSSMGLAKEYPVPGKRRRRRRHPGPDGHTHDPLHPEPDTHIHPPWSDTKDGAGDLYKRIEVLHAFYSAFPSVFKGDGAAWFDGEEAPRPVAWRWLKHGQLVPGVGFYRNSKSEYRIGFCWAGRNLDEKALVERWNNRFSDRRLVGVSEAGELERERDKYIDPPDPDYDPTPQLSGYAMFGPDSCALYLAHRAIPRTYYIRSPAFLWVDTGTGVRVREGVATPSIDDVADRFSDQGVGMPQHLCPDRQEDGEPGPRRPQLPVYIRRTAPLSNVLGFRIFTFLADWSGLTREQIVRLCQDSWGRADEMLKAMLALDLIQVKEGMYYLGSGGCTYLANLDGVHVNTVRARVDREIREDHKQVRAHRRHTIGRNDMMIAMREAGLSVYPGWRTLHNIPDVTQIPPDALLLVLVNHGTNVEGPVLVFVEFERSARNPADVEKKFEPYVKTAREGQPIYVVFVCETDEGAANFRAEVESVYREEGLLVIAMVATLREVKEGPLTGLGAVWNVLDIPVELM